MNKFFINKNYGTFTSVNDKITMQREVLFELNFKELESINKIANYKVNGALVYLRYAGNKSFLYLLKLLILRRYSVIFEIPTPPSILFYGSIKQRFASMALRFLSGQCYALISPVNCHILSKHKNFHVLPNGSNADIVELTHSNFIDRLPNFVWAGSDLNEDTVKYLHRWWRINSGNFPDSYLLIAGKIPYHINSEYFLSIRIKFLGELNSDQVTKLFNYNRFGIGSIPREKQISLDFSSMKHRDMISNGMLLVLFCNDSHLEYYFKDRILKLNINQVSLDDRQVNFLLNFNKPHNFNYEQLYQLDFKSRFRVIMKLILNV